MHTPRRLALAATLLTLCAIPAALPQATNIPSAVARTMTVSTNGVVKAPKTVIYWPTQTNYFHRATITNLTAVTAGVTGNATIGGTLGVTGASTLASVGVTGNATIGGTLGVTGTINGPGSGITGVLAANVPIVDAGGLLTGTNVETALAEIASGLDAVDTSTYVAKSGTNEVSNGWRLNVSGTAGAQALRLTATEDTPILTLSNGVYGVELSIDPSTGHLLRNGYVVYDSNSDGAGSLLDADLFNGNTVEFFRNAGNLNMGTLPAGRLGRTVIQWSMREFMLEEGSTNVVGWTQYTNTSGSRRFSTDAVTSSVATDQIATLRSSIKRVPYGFAAFDSTAAFKLTWASNDSGGDIEIRGITITGWTDLTSTETVLHTDSTVRDVTAAGTPTVVSIASGSFSASTTVPTYIAIDVLLSLEDGDKAGILVAELISQ